MMNKLLYQKYVDRSGLTDAEIAERVGLTTRQYHRRLNNNQFFVDDLERLEKLLNIPIWISEAVFFGEAKGNAEEAEREREGLVKAVEKLPYPQTIKLLRIIAEGFLDQAFIK